MVGRHGAFVVTAPHSVLLTHCVPPLPAALVGPTAAGMMKHESMAARHRGMGAHREAMSAESLAGQQVGPGGAGPGPGRGGAGAGAGAGPGRWILVVTE